MASSSGNSSSTVQLQNSGSEGEPRQLRMDQRKRKRMESNRESARRSRMRKQKHLDDLTSQVTRLAKENNQILTGITVATQHLVNVESENSVLQAQVTELSHRLDSLNEILNSIYQSSGVADADQGLDLGSPYDGFFMSPMNLGCVSHPITAASDVFECR
ncbi:bZIP transcription factor 44 [Syzygium oleosum]|uniref:bZIP transcription factor 44 n=1 Tax=Syzygium oleosum TaxID=219896 RepID=UPI0011D2304D|nr:bZIP transcription factor 44 [Syzygium oleosum]